VKNLNKCLCNKCCLEVNFHVSNDIAESSAIEECSLTKCGYRFEAILHIEGVLAAKFDQIALFEGMPQVTSNYSKFTNLQIGEITGGANGILNGSELTTVSRHQAPSGSVPSAPVASVPVSIKVPITMMCTYEDPCTEVWNEYEEVKCNGELANNLSIALGVPTLTIPPELNGCLIEPDLSPGLAAAAATTSADVHVDEGVRLSLNMSLMECACAINNGRVRKSLSPHPNPFPLFPAFFLSLMRAPSLFFLTQSFQLCLQLLWPSLSQVCGTFQESYF